MPSYIVHLYPVVRVCIPIDAPNKEQAVVDAINGFEAAYQRQGLVVGAEFADDFHDPCVVDVEGDEEHQETTEHYHGDGEQIVPDPA